MAKTFTEKVIKEFKNLGFNDKYKVRLLKGEKETFLDIREYIKTDTYEGFTKKGIRLYWSDILTLQDGMLEEIAELMGEAK